MSGFRMRPFNATTTGLFLHLLIRPARTIERVLTTPPRFGSIVIFLTIISLLRGVLDGVLVLLNDEQLWAMWVSGRLLAWFTGKAVPLLLADWLAVYVRWFGFALVPYLLGRFCGGTGRLVDFLRLYGIALGIYVVTVLPNFAYFFVPLPLVRFDAAPQFRPALGVGQIFTSTWLAWVTYVSLRRVHGLPAFESLAIGMLTPALNIAALVLPGAIIFNLPSARLWSEQLIASSTLLGFSAASVVLIAGALLLMRWVSSAERRSSGGSTASHPGSPHLIHDSSPRSG
ncbi:MAG TPA: Yip1 family protein [Herpetosiphonaceae bacterium]